MGAQDNPPSQALAASVAGASQLTNHLAPVAMGKWWRVLVVVLLLYALTWTYAIAVDRHLYFDAAYHLYRIETESGFLSAWGSFSQDFFRSRAFAFWITQPPAVVASDVFGISGKALSIAYGVGLVGAKLVPLIVLWALTKPEFRTYLLFPLAALWVGTASADLVIVSEGHITSALIWIPLFYVLGLLRTGAVTSGLTLLAAAALLLAYESMSVLGLLVSFAGVWSLLRTRPLNLPHGASTNRLMLGAVTLLSAGASALSVASILMPRDVSNRDGILNASLATLDGFASGYIPAISIVLPLLFTLLLASSLVASRLPIATQWKTALLVAMAVLGASATIHHVADFPLGLTASGAYAERMFSLLVVPAAFVSLMIGTRFLHERARFSGWANCLLRAMPMPIATAAVIQITVSLWMTTAWIRDTAQLELSISKSIGSVSCRDLFALRMPASNSAGSMICNWTVTPLSILLYGKGSQAIAVDPLASFTPVNVTTRDFRKHVAPRFGLGAYYSAKELTSASPYVFTSEGWNSPPIVDGLSWPEPHGTWTDDKIARINICTSEDASAHGRLVLRFFAFLSEDHPSQRVIATLGESQPVPYVAAFAPGPLKIHVMQLPSTPPPGRCEMLTLHLPDAVSPASIRPDSNDPRLLGIALTGISLQQ